MQRDVQLSTTQPEDKKQPYEKPQLGTVRLFADMVLGDCKDDGCNNPSLVSG